jgi:cell fate regulator YaaT (PSP1 superfamily)
MAAPALTRHDLRVAAIRFHKVGKLYHFDAGGYPELSPGDYVIVETARGRQMGQIMGWVSPEQADMAGLKPIMAPASARDLMLKMLYEAKEVEALVICREAASEIREFDNQDIKFVQAKYNYDGSVLAFIYTSEDQIDTSRLRRKLVREFSARIDMRRIGARDAAKLLGEYGACGAPRCCSTHLTEFSPISIKMAKAQGISLNPSEITGMCGRLRCCLIYEYEQYVEARKSLPRVGKRIGTPHGDGKVIGLNALAETATVIVEDKRYEVAKDDITPLEEFMALKAKSAQGCSREGQAGPCECGSRIRSGNPPAESEGQALPPTPEAAAPQAPQAAAPRTELTDGERRQERKEENRGKRGGPRRNRGRRGGRRPSNKGGEPPKG